MIIKLFVVFLLVGCVAGLLAGALGLGGGVVIVPALLLVFHWLGFGNDVLVHMAVATSLSTIVVTSLNSVRTHHGAGYVRWPLVLRISAGIVVGALAGAFVADWFSGDSLERLFGGFAMLVALQMALFGRAPHVEGSERLPPTPGLVLAGGVIGLISSLFGIGGGSLTVPFLSACRVRMQEAVAASAACGLPIAVAGTTGFVISGWAEPGRPDWSLGYVYLPAFAGIVLASYPMARVGARFSHRLPSARLKKVFAVVLFVIGLKLAIG